uniref:DUF2281 domain-containing protein n=1 Tax=Candidatus Kentrum sp. FM TaxID=2126340 RepID=A0A450SF63_9GAMM|nr:MAG: hypothetical protein BECKFM1743C_GA0114222_100232 [Candidatus Kentron sp. FM]VFJ51450.1 MAG: hypothetical protein BECKFM1743A_GA0114220_100942 [Candidatus Kentron sp. FM]VFK05878.1 MAG: hypothetical protein BECKFM1743B_GA0114221_100062 [Candidatus Kentron sp. FM]
MTLQEKIRTHTERLPENVQQEILAFIQSIESRHRQPKEDIDSPLEPTSSHPVSALDLALTHGLVGYLEDGPMDLSTNRNYLQGYGE